MGAVQLAAEASAREFRWFIPLCGITGFLFGVLWLIAPRPAEQVAQRTPVPQITHTRASTDTETPNELTTSSGERWYVVAEAEWPMGKARLVRLEREQYFAPPKRFQLDSVRLRVKAKEHEEFTRFINELKGDDWKIYALLDFATRLTITDSFTDRNRFQVILTGLQGPSDIQALLKGQVDNPQKFGIQGPITPEMLTKIRAAAIDQTKEFYEHYIAPIRTGAVRVSEIAEALPPHPHKSYVFGALADCAVATNDSEMRAKYLKAAEDSAVEWSSHVEMRNNKLSEKLKVVFLPILLGLSGTLGGALTKLVGASVTYYSQKAIMHLVKDPEFATAIGATVREVKKSALIIPE